MEETSCRAIYKVRPMIDVRHGPVTIHGTGSALWGPSRIKRGRKLKAVV